MSDTVIRVENLGKKYRLGEPVGYKTLRESLMQAAAAPMRWLKHSSGANGAGASADKNSADDLWALKDVSFEVNRGEVVGIIGRNGAGKSTLLKILSRITEPTTGRVDIEGRVGSLLEVGTGFHPELTGRENIYLNGAILGMSKLDIAKKFDEIVAFSEMDRFLDTPVKRYSSGMYMRLAFAVAAHLEPEVLIVDEVLAVGDAEFQKKCLGKMQDVGRSGRTVLFVSHNMSAVESLCGRVIRLANGIVAGNGDPGDEIAQYLFTPAASSSREALLGRHLSLRRMTFEPEPVVSGGPLTFHFELGVDRSLLVTDLAMLFFSSSGQRVAIIDLRDSQGQPRVIEPGAAAGLTVSGQIRSFPFIEGRYSVGLYIRLTEPDHTSITTENIFDVAHVTVRPNTKESALIPYEVAHRGIVNLDANWSSAA